ncbi:hypothetical protein [Streptomyces microflavus]|uniref:hypothetical protein n=1 Tax=Streptomyces microflavus TaxID=1919 RepID=UPI002E338C16|nr:hypothetical protein [Streptomyces microflavus]
MRAADVPELRAELSAFANSPDGASYWEGHARTVDYYRSIDVTGADLARAVQNSLEGDLFAVTGPMGELAVAAGQSLGLFDMEAQDLPTPTGVLFFEDPPELLQGIDGDDLPLIIQGAAWSVGDDGEGGYAWITPIAQMSSDQAIRLGGPRLLPFSMADEAPAEERERMLFDHLIVTLRAAWLLMQQPLSEESTLEPDRATRKRLRRVGREPAEVRLIELRRPKGASGQSGGDGDREYHHQWIVRGHWRQQWYPARQVHRPVWIAPHVKGPEGAPLLGGEKVNVLKR